MSGKDLERIAMEEFQKMKFPSWEQFSSQHPEVDLVLNEKGNVTDVKLPESVTEISKMIISDQVYFLEYYDHGELVHYESEAAYKSQISKYAAIVRMAMDGIQSQNA